MELKRNGRARFAPVERIGPGRLQPGKQAERPAAPAARVRGAALQGFFAWVRSAFAAWRQRRAADLARPSVDDGGLAGKITVREALTEVLLAIPSAGIAVLTYYGVSLPLSETGSTVVQKGQALGFALTIGVFAWLTWFFLFGLIHRLSGERLRNGLIAGAVMVGGIALIDAPFNMLALAGGPAAQMSLVDMTRSYERQRDALLARVTALRHLLPAIKVQAARFDGLETKEEKTGAFSGKGHPGKVSASFGQLGQTLGGLARELETGLGKVDALQGDLTKAFAELKSYAYRAGSIRARQEGAASAADRIDALLGQAGQYDARASIAATLASLDASMPHAQASGDAFAQAQASALGDVAAMARPVADALRAGLAELGPGDAAPVEARRPESPLTAIRTYWWALLPHWCAALFVDLAPAALLILLIAAMREVERGAPKEPGPNPPPTQPVPLASPGATPTTTPARKHPRSDA